MAEIDNKSYTCCFTGHRDFNSSYSEEQIAQWLSKEIRLAVEEGYDTFITGMCYGIDIIAAEEVLKQKAGGYKLSLIAATPYIGFESIMTEQWKERYFNVLECANNVYPVCRSYSRSCFYMRNRWMVDHSSRIIAVYNGKKGGTHNTVMYAATKGLTIRLAPSYFFD